MSLETLSVSKAMTACAKEAQSAELAELPAQVRSFQQASFQNAVLPGRRFPASHALGAGRRTPGSPGLNAEVQYLGFLCPLLL